MARDKITRPLYFVYEKLRNIFVINNLIAI